MTRLRPSPGCLGLAGWRDRREASQGQGLTRITWQLRIEHAIDALVGMAPDGSAQHLAERLVIAGSFQTEGQQVERIAVGRITPEDLSE